jgi:hypothetical protein
MPDPIFYFEKLKTWDKVTIGLYLTVSVGVVFYAYGEGPSGREWLLWFYPFLTHLFLYFFNYRSLRNLTVYFIWCAIGLVHLIIYLYPGDPVQKQPITEFAAKGLRNTILLLLLFQVIRFISIKTQGRELVCPGNSYTDLFDERKITVIDAVLSFTYIFCMLYVFVFIL